MNQNYRIVVGMDLDEPGDDALRMALELARRTLGPEVHLVHVLPAAIDNDVAAMSRMLEEATAMVAGRARAIAGPSDALALRVHVRYGQVVEAILQICVDYDADLVIVGTHGRKGPARLVLGSIASSLVKSAPLPVVVARPKDFSGLARSPSLDAATPGAELHGDQNVSEAIGVGPRNQHVSGLI